MAAARVRLTTFHELNFKLRLRRRRRRRRRKLHLLCAFNFVARNFYADYLAKFLGSCEGGRVRYAGYRNSIRQTPIKRCQRDRLRPLPIDLLSQIIAYLQRGMKIERRRGERRQLQFALGAKNDHIRPFSAEWACQADKPSAASCKLRQAIYTANAYRQIKWKPTCLAKLPASCN